MLNSKAWTQKHVRLQLVFSHPSVNVGCIQVNALFHILFCHPPYLNWPSSRSCCALLLSS